MVKEKPQVEDEQGLKMYCCEVECKFPLIVLAKDPEGARKVAKENADVEFDNLSVWSIFEAGLTYRIIGKKSVPHGWLGALPYYEERKAPDSEKSVNEVINEWNKRKGGE